MSVVVVQIAYLQTRGGRITGHIGGRYMIVTNSRVSEIYPKICIFLSRTLIQKPSIPTIALKNDLYYPASNHAGLLLEVVKV